VRDGGTDRFVAVAHLVGPENAVPKDRLKQALDSLATSQTSETQGKDTSETKTLAASRAASLEEAFVSLRLFKVQVSTIQKARNNAWSTYHGSQHNKVCRHADNYRRTITELGS
jgi:hypothetical protein